MPIGAADAKNWKFLAKKFFRSKRNIFVHNFGVWSMVLAQYAARHTTVLANLCWSLGKRISISHAKDSARSLFLGGTDKKG